ncbi:hypothetical protein [Actinomycetospora atypica]|uniref:Uncharacterized protein n=1 Tax=Actinomycetospora atypica TaxID=1290095 RepID=A0ABV9YPU7_9PSEU
MVTTSSSELDPRTRPVPLARTGTWLLPLYTLLLALTTLTHQPDPVEAFDQYARYVSTPVFLASHLLGSIGGAALGVLGAFAVAALLLAGPAARAGVVGAATFAAGNVVTTAVFGAAAFAQPAIGRAHLAGASGIAAVDRDVYGPALVGTAVVGLLLLVTGAVVLSRAVARTDRTLAGPAIALGGGLVVFVLPGLVLGPAQPVGALVATVGAVLVARGLRRTGPGPLADTTSV